MATKRSATCSAPRDPKKKKYSADTEDKLRLLLVGKTGCGKSSTGNTLLGDSLFPTAVSFSSLTKCCDLQWADRHGTTIEITDSPGLFDTCMDEEEVSRLLMQAVTCMLPGPDAILYVVKLDRYTEEEFKTFSRLKALLDNRVTRYVIIVFTYTDSLQGESVKDLLNNVPDSLEGVLQECDRRYIVFDNTLENPETQVLELLEAVKALKRQNQHVPYKCPKYAHLAQSFRKELKQRLAEVEMKEMSNNKHFQAHVTHLQEALKEAEKEKEKLEADERQRKRVMEQQKKEMDRQLQDQLEALKQPQQLSKTRSKQDLAKRAARMKKDLEARMKKFMKELEARMKKDRWKLSKELRRLAKKEETLQKEIEVEKKKQETAERKRAQEVERELKQEIARLKEKKKSCVVM